MLATLTKSKAFPGINQNVELIAVSFPPRLRGHSSCVKFLMAGWASPAAQRPKKQATHLGLEILTIRHAEKTYSTENIKQFFRNMNHGFIWSKMLTIAYRKEFLCFAPIFFFFLMTHVPSSSTGSKDHTRLDGDHAVAARWPSLSGACPGKRKSCWRRRMKLRVVGSLEKHALLCVLPFLDEDIWLFLEEGLPEWSQKICHQRDRPLKWDCSRLKGHQTQTHPQTRVFEKLQQQEIHKGRAWKFAKQEHMTSSSPIRNSRVPKIQATQWTVQNFARMKAMSAKRRDKRLELWAKLKYD